MENNSHVLTFESFTDDGKDPKDRLLDLLDNVEANVEELRRESLKLEERKDGLFTTLNTIRHCEQLNILAKMDKDDIEQYIDRITARCMTIDISVRTDRNKEQTEALHKVNTLIDVLVVSFKRDKERSVAKCKSFLAACSDDPQAPVDKAFESALLACALDDQKKVKKRLNSLLI